MTIGPVTRSQLLHNTLDATGPAIPRDAAYPAGGGRPTHRDARRGSGQNVNIASARRKDIMWV
jgi:hypothetical protein